MACLFLGLVLTAVLFCPVYRRYASLYFVFCVTPGDNELLVLEMIHHFVEALDKYYDSVCELDIVFNFSSACALPRMAAIVGVFVCVARRPRSTAEEGRNMKSRALLGEHRVWTRCAYAGKEEH